jgi:hypothetical protein
MLSLIIKLAHQLCFNLFLCLFIMVLILYVEFLYILHLLRKARGCCMHVFSSYTWVCENIAECKVVHHFVYVMDGFRCYAHARVQTLSK